MEVDTITEHEAAIYDRQIRLWGRYWCLLVFSVADRLDAYRR